MSPRNRRCQHDRDTQIRRLLPFVMVKKGLSREAAILLILEMGPERRKKIFLKRLRGSRGMSSRVRVSTTKFLDKA